MMKNSLAGIVTGSLLVALFGCAPDAGDEPTTQAQVASDDARQTAPGAQTSEAQPAGEGRLPQLAETAKRGIEQIGGAGAGAHVTPTLPIETDLEQRVRRELAETQGLDLSAAELAEVDVTVDGGTVQLSGNVPSETAADKIEQRVKSISGVENVENYLMADTSQ